MLSCNTDSDGDESSFHCEDMCDDGIHSKLAGCAGAQAGQASLTAQQLEQQRQQVRASILSQMAGSQGSQQPAYANDPRYPSSSLAPLDANNAGVALLLCGLRPVVSSTSACHFFKEAQD